MKPLSETTAQRLTKLNIKYGDDVLPINLVDSLLNVSQADYVLSRCDCYLPLDRLIIIDEELGFQGKSWACVSRDTVGLDLNRSYHFLKLQGGMKLRIQAYNDTCFFTTSRKRLCITDPILSIPRMNFEYIVISKGCDPFQKAFQPEELEVYRLNRESVSFFFKRNFASSYRSDDELLCG